MKNSIRPTLILLLVTLIGPLMSIACGNTVRAGIDDATISTRVKTALLNDPAVGALRIDVNTFNGVVTLSGTVPTPEERDRAVTLARRINGVADVKAQLQVK